MKFEEKKPEATLIRISDGDEYYVNIHEVSGIKKIFSHPNDSTVTKGFPKYQVCLRESAAWKWVIITADDFEKYFKPYILNL